MKNISNIILFIIILLGCENQENSKLYPDSIGSYKLNSVLKGDSAKKEINTLHQLSVATNNNLIIYYGKNKEDILYVTEYESISLASNSYNSMLSKMQSSTNSPFKYIVPMKKYDNSFMTIGLGSVHYIYQSGKYVLWYSTKQKFYNELPKQLLEIYPENN